MKEFQHIRIHHYHSKMILLHFFIEPSEIRRLKYPFKTDMYISILQWEELYARVNSVLVEVLGLSDWKIGKQKGELKVDELSVSYLLIEKSESLMNLDKVKYELDWFMQIKIRRRSRESSGSRSLRTSHTEPTSSDSNSKKHHQHFDTDENSSSSATIGLSGTIDENNAIQSPGKDSTNDGVTHRRNKRPKLDSSSSNLLVDLSNIRKSPRQSRVNTKKGGTQPNLHNWFGVSSPERAHSGSSQSQTKKISKKNSKPKETPTLGLKTGDSVVADLMDDEKRQQFENFLEKSNQEQLQKAKRKNELKNYEMIDCKHLDAKEITNLILSMKDLIADKYAAFASGETKLIINGFETAPCTVTTSNFLTDEQSYLVLNVIQEVCNTFENRLSNEEDFLHELCLPVVIIQILKHTHGLSSQQAYERVREQDEYMSYYGNDTSP